MAKETKDYQTLSLELDEVLSRMQQPDATVDETVKLYERGLKLIEALEKHLADAETKIETLTLAATTKTE